MIASGYADHVFDGGNMSIVNGHNELGRLHGTALQHVILWTAGDMASGSKLPPERAISIIQTLVEGGANRFVTWKFEGFDAVSLPRLAKACEFYLDPRVRIPDEVTTRQIEPQVALYSSVRAL